MTQSKKCAWLVLLSSLFAMATFGAACSGGSKGGTASPTATATVIDYCQVVWSSTGTNAGRYDLYIIDAPLASWTSGDHSFDLTVGMETTAFFYDEFDFSTTPHQYLSRAIATNGTYTVTANGGTDAGQSIALVDSSSQAFFAVDGSGQVGDQVGDGGTGNFGVTSGAVWSDPANPSHPTPGPGTINLTYMGNPVSVGAYVNYALCYDASAVSFAPRSAIERVDAQLARMQAPGN